MIESNCAGCAFAKVKENKQYGCSLNRTKKLKTKQKDSENKNIVDGVEYEIISRFCNTYRPDEWLEKLTLEEKLKASHVVMEEVRPRVGFLVFFDHEKTDISDLHSTLLDIKGQTESNPRYVIVVNSKVEYNHQIHEMLSELFPKDETEIHLLQIINVPENKIWIVDEAFRLALNGWIYVTTSGENIDKNLLKDIHQHLNIKMKKLSVVMPYEGINGLLVQTALFKYLNGNKAKMWDEENIDSRLFLDKIKDMEENENCILDWSQVNAA